MKGTRYQDSPWYVRLWRRCIWQPWSWYLFISIHWHYWRHPEDKLHDDLSSREIWGITQGMWQAKANWLYDLDDLKKEWGVIESEDFIKELGHDPLADPQTELDDLQTGETGRTTPSEEGTGV